MTQQLFPDVFANIVSDSEEILKLDDDVKKLLSLDEMRHFATFHEKLRKIKAPLDVVSAQQKLVELICIKNVLTNTGVDEQHEGNCIYQIVNASRELVDVSGADMYYSRAVKHACDEISYIVFTFLFSSKLHSNKIKKNICILYYFSSLSLYIYIYIKYIYTIYLYIYIYPNIR